MNAVYDIDIDIWYMTLIYDIGYVFIVWYRVYLKSVSWNQKFCQVWIDIQCTKKKIILEKNENKTQLLLVKNQLMVYHNE